MIKIGLDLNFIELGFNDSNQLENALVSVNLGFDIIYFEFGFEFVF